MRSLIQRPVDPTALRQHLERELEHARAVEQAYTLAALAKRLHGHRKLFARHNLFLAFKAADKYPAIYVIRRDHSAWFKIWWCADALRADAYNSFSSSSDWHEVMDVRLTANLDFAERCLIGMLERGELRFGNAYLPGDLHELDHVSVPELSARPVPALPPPTTPPPTIEAQAVEVRTPAPHGLRAVPLAAQPKPARAPWWR